MNSLFATITLCIVALSNLGTFNLNKEPKANLKVTQSRVHALFNSLVGDEDDVFLNNYATQYFSHLTSNFGNNTRGTCAYVAIGMLLSYFDSYWNDSFIPEDYDVKSTFTATSYQPNEFALPTFNAESPGIRFEDYSLVGNLSVSEYEDFIEDNDDTYFQAKLLTLANTYFGSYKFDTIYNPYGMTHSEACSFLSYYLYTYRNFSNTDYVVQPPNNLYYNLRNTIVYEITHNNPVIVFATSNLGCHAMIAYDYDSVHDKIYVHPGWKDTNGNVLTHVTLEDLGFTTLDDFISISKNTSHSHSFNYHPTNYSSDVCSCNYSFPQNISITNGNFRDMLPTYHWDALYDEVWLSSYSPYFKVSFLDSNSNTLFIRNVTTNSYTLTQSEWDQILCNLSGDSYQVYVELTSDTYPYLDDIFAIEEFDKPVEYNHVPVIVPTDYDYDDAYPSDSETMNTFINHETQDGFTFQTRRFRTGYIHNEYIVMSPRRFGFTEAFIEYRFTYGVDRIDVALSHWREISTEGLTPQTGTAVIQYRYGINYTTKLDLLASSTALPEDRNNQRIYRICFATPVYVIRFYSSTFEPNYNDRNRGRICIGDMAVYENTDTIPLSGSELDYDPNSWNDSNVSDYNCYAYSLNTKSHGFMQPGGSEGHYYGNTANYYTQSVLEEMVELDSINYNFVFTPIDKEDICNPGTYKVALAIAPNQDYHWYRQNSDGSWSHKPGSSLVTRCDFQGDNILDPEYCDRRYWYGFTLMNYSQFVGFYAVSPLS